MGKVRREEFMSFIQCLFMGASPPGQVDSPLDENRSNPTLGFKSHPRIEFNSGEKSNLHKTPLDVNASAIFPEVNNRTKMCKSYISSHLHNHKKRKILIGAKILVQEQNSGDRTMMKSEKVVG